MLKVIASAVSFTLLGCGASLPREASVRPVAAEEARRATDEAERDATLRELRGRLALAEAAARDLRDEVETLRSPPRETVRIRGEAPPPELYDDEPAADRGPRPVLRLYGEPESPVEDTSAPFVADDLVGTLGPLPVTTADARIAYEPPRPAPDAALPRYTEGLGLMRERRFVEASQAFARFVELYASDPAQSTRVASARYWQGQALYAAREYGAAAALLRAFVGAHLGHPSAPDALLALAHCYERMGERARAREALQRLRRDFAGSVAARVASREGAS